MNDPDTSIAPSTWADNFGQWHACVPASGRWRKDAIAARKLIMDELLARAPRGSQPHLQVTLKETTEFGTVVYVEKSI